MRSGFSALCGFLVEETFLFGFGSILLVSTISVFSALLLVWRKNDIMNRKMMYTKADILEKVQSVLNTREEIIFAYLFGSFTEEVSFRDIDIAVYCDEEHPRLRNLFYDIELARELESVLGIPVDLVILNHAPDYIVYRASRGILIKDMDEDFRCDFLVLRWKTYLDFQEVLKKYAQEFKNAHR